MFYQQLDPLNRLFEFEELLKFEFFLEKTKKFTTYKDMSRLQASFGVITSFSTVFEQIY